MNKNLKKIHNFLNSSEKSKLKLISFLCTQKNCQAIKDDYQSTRNTVHRAELTHCCQECVLVQPFRYLKVSDTEDTSNIATITEIAFLLLILPSETHARAYQKTCIRIFIKAPFVIYMQKKLPKFPPAVTQINIAWYIWPNKILHDNTN